MSVKPIPDGYHTATPYLIVKGRGQRPRLLQEGTRRYRDHALSGPDGAVMHAEIQIGNSILMLADENPAMGARAAPKRLAGRRSASCLRRGFGCKASTRLSRRAPRWFAL